MGKTTLGKFKIGMNVVFMIIKQEFDYIENILQEAEIVLNKKR